MAAYEVAVGQKLADAQAKCVAGDTILLTGGIYVEDFKLSKSIQLLQKPNTPPSTLKGRLVVSGTTVTVAGKTLTLDGRSPSNLPSPTVTGKTVTFKDVFVTNEHSGIAFNIGSVQYGIAQAVLLDGVTIARVGKLPPTNHDHGVYIASARSTIIRNTLIYDCADRGIQFYPDSQNTLVEYTLIWNCGEGVIFGGALGSESGEGAANEYRYSDNNLVRKSIIGKSTVRSLGEAWWGSPAGLKGKNNLIDDCIAVGKFDLSEGGFSVSPNIKYVTDPQFTDPSNGNFMLKPGSAAIGYGPASIQPTQATPPTPPTPPTIDPKAEIDAAMAALTRARSVL